jgi:hypothetical protein
MEYIRNARTQLTPHKDECTDSDYYYATGGPVVSHTVDDGRSLLEPERNELVGNCHFIIWVQNVFTW